jgi:hypothetical protein
MAPYGSWTCADGREVAFNRDYTPILTRFPGGACAPADPTEWVPWVKQLWLYRDGTAPAVVKARIDWLLAVWGLPPLPPMPRRYTSGLNRSERRRLPNPYGWVAVA